MPLDLSGKTQLQSLRLTGTGVRLDVLRLDLVHPVVSGNKWFKLRKYLEEARQLGRKRIISFGGAWSNHILATAAACREEGFHSTGIIRGERPPALSFTLKEAQIHGMELVFVPREKYRMKKVPLNLSAEDSYVIPEGGYGIRGAEGAATILEETDIKPYTHIIAAAGTGTMVAGLTLGALTGQKIIGISVLKNNRSLEKEVSDLLPIEKRHQFSLLHDYPFGGYARYSAVLIAFMNEWYRQHSIPTDFVYTGKLFYAIQDLVIKNFFQEGARILAIHSGGLQGNRSLPKGTLIF